MIVSRAILLSVLLDPALATAAGLGSITAGSKGFKAGQYTNRAASIAKLGAADLKHASKAENIDGLLALARTERRVDLDEVGLMQAWGKYNALPEGDRLLLGCLKDAGCQPLTCADIAALSELHREVMLRQPGRNLTQANHTVGHISEQVMLRHFESTGWQRIEGQMGRGGIDGLFVKRNAEGAVREVLVVESKYNTGALAQTDHGQQMSRNWVDRKLAQLRERQPDDATYRKVEDLINGGHYRARLWTLRVENGEIRIDLQRVRSANYKVDELIDDPGTRVLVPPPVIRIAAPKDSFEKTIVDAYWKEIGSLGGRP